LSLIIMWLLPLMPASGRRWGLRARPPPWRRTGPSCGRLSGSMRPGAPRVRAEKGTIGVG